jgi:hypothetical protein
VVGRVLKKILSLREGSGGSSSLPLSLREKFCVECWTHNHPCIGGVAISGSLRTLSRQSLIYLHNTTLNEFG